MISIGAGFHAKGGELSSEEQREEVRVGLCYRCRYVRQASSPRGVMYYRCARAETDAAYRKYPPLPVLQCRGYILRDTPTEPPP